MANQGLDLDEFISACRAALKEDPPQRAVREIMARSLAHPTRLRRALAEPTRAQIQKLHHEPDLTVLHLVWAPNMCFMPHDHRMWAVIGILDGREDNIFWRRIQDQASGCIEAAGAKALSAGDCVTLGMTLSTLSPTQSPVTRPRFTSMAGTFRRPAQRWDPETLTEQPYSAEKVVRMFEDRQNAWRRLDRFRRRPGARYPGYQTVSDRRARAGSPRPRR
jgi:hypothetical protein